ncbi:hypothetical protein AB0K64_33920 [Streptomyces sp. NPDC053741]|uniref:hypothetical protein n=1 Tax=Streptomyces TaxID=1883 RepID=UPI003433D3A7
MALILKSEPSPLHVGVPYPAPESPAAHGRWKATCLPAISRKPLTERATVEDKAFCAVVK